MAHKIIITCAVTGSIHTPSMSPYLPVSAEEIAQAALGAAEAGAAIVHLHARDPKDGRPDQSPEAFEPFLRVIKQNSDVIVNLTTGGSPYMPVEERVRPAAVWKPEIASLNMGSMNFGLFPMLKRKIEFKHEWEPAMLEGSHDLVFRNSFKDIRYALETLNQTGARYEFECYDTSHLHNLRYFCDEGLVKPPYFIQTAFGLLGGIGLDNRYTFPLIRDLVDEVVLVNETEIAAAMVYAVRQEKQIVEGGGSVGIGLVQKSADHDADIGHSAPDTRTIMQQDRGGKPLQRRRHAAQAGSCSVAGCSHSPRPARATSMRCITRSRAGCPARRRSVATSPCCSPPWC